MKHDIETGTDAGMVALLDPDILKDEEGAGDWDRLAGRLDEYVDQGRMLVYEPGGDGGVHARLLVEQEPAFPEDFRVGRVVDGARLAVPSGQLWFLGAELLPGSLTGQTADGSDDEALGTQVEVPPGDYRLDVDVLVPTDEASSQRHDRIEAMTEARADRFDWWFTWWFSPLAGIGFVVGAILGMVGLLMLAVAETSTALTVLGVAAVVGLVGVGLGLSPPMRRVGELHRQAEREHPTCWIRLTRLEEGADPSQMADPRWHIDDELALRP